MSGGRDEVLCVLDDELLAADDVSLGAEGALAGLLDEDVVFLLVRLDVASLVVRLEEEVLDEVLDDEAFDEDFTLDEDDDVAVGLEDEVLLVEGFDLGLSDPPVVLRFFSLSLIVSQHP